MQTEPKSPHARPVSPHISIYRPQISSVLSIMHRITGLALFAGSSLIVLWLWSAAYAPVFYSTLHDCLSSWFGQLCLFGWVAAFYYHLGNGIRHLFWDVGLGFSLPVMRRSGLVVLAFAAVMTCVTWFVAMTSTGAMS